MENANTSLKHSAQINEIASALAKAQGTMKPAVFNRTNPHFKSKYADFTSCMDACREPLSSNGLAITQLPTYTTDGKFILNTLLLHTSGQWMACEFPLNAKSDNIQAIGSSLSYAKRYSLCGMLGIVADEDIDDDGESAVSRPQAQQRVNPVVNTPAPIVKVNAGQSELLKSLDQKLNGECREKINKWLMATYKTENLAELPQESFTKIVGAYENAIKFMENEKLSEAVNA